MTAKASPAGWVVQVTIRPRAAEDAAGWVGTRMPGAPSFKYFNVAIPEADRAMEATSKYLAKANAPDGEMRTVRGLSPEEIAVLKLKAGEVKPA